MTPGREAAVMVTAGMLFGALVVSWATGAWSVPCAPWNPEARYGAGDRFYGRTGFLQDQLWHLRDDGRFRVFLNVHGRLRLRLEEGRWRAAGGAGLLLERGDPPYRGRWRCVGSLSLGTRQRAQPATLDALAISLDALLAETDRDQFSEAALLSLPGNRGRVGRGDDEVALRGRRRLDIPEDFDLPLYPRWDLEAARDLAAGLAAGRAQEDRAWRVPVAGGEALVVAETDCYAADYTVEALAEAAAARQERLMMSIDEETFRARAGFCQPLAIVLDRN